MVGTNTKQLIITTYSFGRRENVPGQPGLRSDCAIFAHTDGRLVKTPSAAYIASSPNSAPQNDNAAEGRRQYYRLVHKVT